MTTAHRPTFHAAIGGKEQGGGRYIAGVTRVHVHDLAGQMTLKKRCAAGVCRPLAQPTAEPRKPRLAEHQARARGMSCAPRTCAPSSSSASLST